ncbi:dynein heavy chain [Trametes maxima]|nr:dynein heavy chain [Trametes maxima]
MTGVEGPLAPLTNDVGRPNGSALNGNVNGDVHDTPVTEPAIQLDPEVFRSYLLSLLPSIVGASPEELEPIFDEDFHERVSRFAGEGGGVIYVVKQKDDHESPILDSTSPLATQLHILDLFGSDETPYESLHAPYFEAFVGARGGGKDGDSKMGIPVTKKKFAELELSLLHLQQNVEIPETHLIIHPVIQRTVEQSRQNGQRPSISDLSNKLLNDSSFLNTLQNHINQWIKSIQTVTKLTRDVSSGIASQEINFWLSLERTLEGINAQLRSDEVIMVMECLRNAKRFHATVSFLADTGLNDAMDTVHKYNQLMKDFPLNELLSATDLNKIQEGVVLIFGHINPIRRVPLLVEVISRDFNDQLLRVLTSHRLLYTPYDTFELLLSQMMAIFRTWDDHLKEFTNVAREVTRKRSEKFIPIKVLPAHAKLQGRIRYLRDWRKQHEQLAVMTAPTKGLGGVDNEIGGMDMEAEVKEAYEVMKRIDVLDVSTEGGEIWVAAENAYNERNQIIARLCDRLGTARNANEMFRVFSKFNALFVRPKEYQTQLIDSVKEDIKCLHEKASLSSEAYHMSQMRDLPPISGAIIWARQIDRQLQTYMKRVEDVLGKGWELYAEGQKLQSESSAFRKKLDVCPMYEAWLHDINRRDMGVNGRLFEIVRLRGGGYQLAVNFDPQITTLFKEVRNLLWQNFQVPHAITNMAKDVKRATLSTCRQLDGDGMHGMNIRWDHFVNQYNTARYVSSDSAARDNRHIQFVREFASVDKTNNVIDLYKDILRSVEELSTCPYTPEAFRDLLGKIQAAIDRLNLEGYANLDHWVAELDQRIEGILLQRITHVIQLFCSEFERADDSDGRREPVTVASKRRDKHAKNDKSTDGTLTLAPTVHEIQIQNQVIFLDPPIEHARAVWVHQLHEWLGTVCHLRRIQSSRYEIGLQMQGHTVTDLTYTSLLTRFPDNMALEKPFALIEQKVQSLKDYQLLTEIKKARSTFDTSETQKSFGVCVIDYEQVRARVNAKYDAWQHDILSHFGVKLGNAMKEMHASILTSKRATTSSTTR